MVRVILTASVTLANDPNDVFIAELVDPNGQTVGYSTNAAGENEVAVTGSPSVSLYKVNPIPGTWSLIVEWLNPVTGNELTEPFSGTIGFNQVNVTSNLPNGFTKISTGTTQTYKVNVTNTGTATEAYYIDPRLNQNVTISLPDLNGSPSNMSLPLPAGEYFPIYAVPSQTSQLQASITGSAPVTFDLEYFPGDPDISPGLNTRWSTTGGIHGDSANVTLNEPEVSPGLWLLNPAEEGPFPASGAPTVTASANLKRRHAGL